MAQSADINYYIFENGIFSKLRFCKRCTADLPLQYNNFLLQMSGLNRSTTEEHPALTDDAVSDFFIDNEDINNIAF